MNKLNEIIKKKKIQKKGKILTNQHRNLNKKKNHRHCGVRDSRLRSLCSENGISDFFFFIVNFQILMMFWAWLKQHSADFLVITLGSNIGARNNKKKKSFCVVLSGSGLRWYTILLVSTSIQ